MDPIYIFRLTAYNKRALMPQVVKALETRANLIEHAKRRLPWQKREPFDPERHDYVNNDRAARIRGGIAFAICALCIAGALAFESAMIVLLIAAIIALGFGIMELWSSRPGRPKLYAKSAEKLLEGKDKFLAEDGIEVKFYETGMLVGKNFIPFGEFLCGFETADTFLVVYGPLVTLLQKKDLTLGDEDGFREYLRTNLPAFLSI